MIHRHFPSWLSEAEEVRLFCGFATVVVKNFATDKERLKTMKFAEHLAAHITPEWRKQYIQYEVSDSDFRKTRLCSRELPRLSMWISV